MHWTIILTGNSEKTGTEIPSSFIIPGKIPIIPGFGWFGEIFQNYGAKITAIKEAPTAKNLAGKNVYIIVDPDTQKETAEPNFVDAGDIIPIKKWVYNGGTLILMANDTSNCEIPRFNELSKAFGIEFTGKSRNMVKVINFIREKLTFRLLTVYLKTRNAFM